MASLGNAIRRREVEHLAARASALSTAAELASPSAHKADTLNAEASFLQFAQTAVHKVRVSKDKDKGNEGSVEEPVKGPS